MQESKTIECLQIRYHITYDENLTLKDLEDLINLIRISNNDALQEMGISRSKGNDLQRIEKIEPGSIEIIMGILDVISVAEFVFKSGKLIYNKIKSKRERPNRNPREDRKVYEKYDVSVKVEERPEDRDQNIISYVVNVYVGNGRGGN